MSEVQEWLYIDAAGQQVGPVPADQLHEYVSAGHITAESQVWTEGMEEWLPASQVEGLIPPVAAPIAQAVVAAAPANPQGAPAEEAIPQEGGDYPIPAVNKIGFGLYVTCLVGGIVAIIAGMILAGSSALSAAAENPNELTDPSSGSIVFPIVLSVLGAIVLLVSSVIQLLAIHRVWTVLKPGGGTVSPGKAVGFLFIPVFGAIWAIIILCKLPGEWNTIVSRYVNTVESPRLSTGIAICAILIPVIGQILWMREVAKAVNFMASARLMSSAIHQQSASQGGIVLR